MNYLRAATILLAFTLLPLRAQVIEVTRADTPDVQWLWALYQGDVEWTQELIGKGYKVNGPLPQTTHPMYGVAINRGARFPIQVAVSGGGAELIKFLARQGANLKVKTSDGSGLMPLAYDRPKAAAALLELKVDAQARDKQGNTILHLAVGSSRKLYEEQEEVLKLFASNAKLKSAKNRKRKTAADIAVAHTNEKAVAILAPKRLAEIEKIKKAQKVAIAKADKAKATEYKNR